MNDIKREISYFTEEIYEEIIKIRHALHEHPELSYEEFETAELVERTLSNWQIPSRRGGHASENFYQFSRTVPSVFFRLGIHDARLGPSAAAHSPRFTAADASLKTGISVMTAAVLTFLAEKGACDG